eukprot:8551721-Pyramimonas_sp.AAC.1
MEGERAREVVAKSGRADLGRVHALRAHRHNHNQKERRVMKHTHTHILPRPQPERAACVKKRTHCHNHNQKERHVKKYTHTHTATATTRTSNMLRNTRTATIIINMLTWVG